MCLDSVNIGLLQVCQITETHLGVSYRQIDRKASDEETVDCGEVNWITPLELPSEKIS